MSISNNYSPTKTLGNGTTTEFSFPWRAISSDDVKVFFEVAATGVQTEQLSGFTTTLNADGTGKVTFSSAPASTNYVIIKRETDPEQLIKFSTSRGFDGQDVEDALDIGMAITQESAEDLSRAVKVKLGSSSSGLVFPEPEADKIIAWNSAGTALENSLAIDEVAAAQTYAANAASSASDASDSADAAASSASDASDSADEAAASAASVGFTLSTNNIFTGTNIFQDVIDVAEVNAETSAGGDLRTNGGTSCLAWGSGGTANLTAGGNLSMNTTHKIVNCADPSSAQDVATKAYVDAAVPASGVVPVALGRIDQLTTSTISLVKDINIASVAVNGGNAGNFTVTLDNAMSDSSYIVMTTVGAAAGNWPYGARITAQTTTTFTVQISDGNSDIENNYDHCSFVIYGTVA